MIKTTLLSLLASASLLSLTSVHADVRFNSIRLGTVDSEVTAEFYKKAFGMIEVRRIDTATGPEIFLNFGATLEAARANTAPPVVLMNRAGEPLEDDMAHLILTVSDATATAAAAREAGGSVPVEPRAYRDTPIMIGFVADPDGNRIELIQPAPRQ